MVSGAGRSVVFRVRLRFRLARFQQRSGQLRIDCHKHTDPGKDVEHGEHPAEIGLGREIVLTDGQDGRDAEKEGVDPFPAFYVAVEDGSGRKRESDEFERRAELRFGLISPHPAWHYDPGGRM